MEDKDVAEEKKMAKNNNENNAKKTNEVKKKIASEKNTETSEWNDREHEQKWKKGRSGEWERDGTKWKEPKRDKLSMDAMLCVVFCCSFHSECCALWVS